MSKINLNFASNESWFGAKSAWQCLWRQADWQQGQALDELATTIGQSFQVPSSQVFFSLAARSSLRLFLESLQLPRQSEVLVQAFTCEAVVLPVLASQLVPIYVDIEKKTWSMSLSDLKKKASSKSRVLILQHTFGMLPVERSEILAWAKAKNILMIEDLAHGFAPALLAEPGNSTKLLSFGRSKFFSSVHGGGLVLSDATLAAKLSPAFAKLAPASRSLITKALLYKILAPIIRVTYALGGKFLHGLLNHLGVFGREISQIERQGDYDGWLDRQLPNVLASFILEQWQSYESMVEDRQKVAQFYQTALSGDFLPGHWPILRYPILLKNAEAILAKLAKKGLVLGNWYRQVVAPVGLDLGKVQCQAGSCPVAEEFSQQVLNLPLNVSLDQAASIVEELKNV